MQYPYLLQEKLPNSNKWETVYSFGLKSETQARIDEYQSYWKNRSVRVAPNKKYKSKN